jgi:hypothetical protein
MSAKPKPVTCRLNLNVATIELVEATDVVVDAIVTVGPPTAELPIFSPLSALCVPAPSGSLPPPLFAIIVTSPEAGSGLFRTSSPINSSFRDAPAASCEAVALRSSFVGALPSMNGKTV